MTKPIAIRNVKIGEDMPKINVPVVEGASDVAVDKARALADCRFT